MYHRPFLFVTTLLVALLPSSLVGAAAIQGHVRGGSRPLAGVCVSDGYRIVRTEPDGRYQVDVDENSGRFIFISVPRGFWTDEFYVPVTKARQQTSVDFTLEPVAQSERFDFVFLTDMHLEGGNTSIAKFDASLREIDGLDPRPAFLLLQGDICLQAKGVGDRYQECLKRVRIPMRNGAGNHEMILAESNPRADFERRFGPTYYSFNWAQLHCIVLDGNKPIPGRTGWQAVHGAVEGRELAWLKADLATQPAGKLIVVGVHIPIVSTYPNRRQTSPANAPYWEMTNAGKLTDLLARHHVRLVLQGHMHENERETVGGVEYVESISICGSWWKHGEGFERGVDNSPRGYRIISIDGNRLTHRYQSSAESRVAERGEFVGLSKPIAPSPTTSFRLNCYDAPNKSTVEARIDAGPWQPMQHWAAPSPATPGLTMPHHYRWTTSTARLRPGPHTISARVTFPDKRVVKVTQVFSVGES